VLRGLRTGDIGVVALLGIFALGAVVVLGGASLGGWPGIAIAAAGLLSLAGVVALWSGAPDESP
jgi:hypothetical protein